jgi:hypothetical protein
MKTAAELSLRSSRSRDSNRLQLKAIAASQSNSTYFFGDRAAMGVASDVEAFNVDYAQSVRKGLGKEKERKVDVVTGAVGFK